MTRKLSEHQHQKQVITWARGLAALYPERYGVLDYLHSIPNGAHLAGNAKRRYAQINKLKNEGLLPGVPDLCLPVARRGYHGLYVEMKRDDKAPVSEDQTRWLDWLAEQGYCALLCVGADDAIEQIEWYLGDTGETHDEKQQSTATG